ncbi:MAG: glycosyltransferase family 39 protein [Ruminococcus sp.]|nr:glycosyltransferase family 39 protein [Ruminococcus sp.]
MEFPIYQSVVYFIMKILHKTNIDVWCRLVSLATFYLSVFVLKKVADLVIDKKSAYCSCLIYLFAPFTILWSRAAMIDYMSVLFALIYVWGLYSWLVKGKKTIIITLLFGCMGYLLKVTTMFPYIFFLAYLIIRYFYEEIIKYSGKFTLHTIFAYIGRNKVRIIILAVLCILPVISGVCWIRYADAVKEQSVFTSEFTSEALRSWNYGTMEQKLQISNWSIVLRRLVQYIGGVPVAGCLILLYLFLGKRRNLSIVISCTAASILTIFILFNLYDFHDYYFIALTPMLSMIYGVMLFTGIEKLFSAGNWGKTGVLVLVFVIIFAEGRTNAVYLKYAITKEERGADADWLIALGSYVGSITEPDERIVTQGEYAIATLPYYADRKAMMIIAPYDETFYTDFLQQDNYTTLVEPLPSSLIGELAKYYEIIIQYPGTAGRDIYKFYHTLPTKYENLIKIRYSHVEEQMTVAVEFVNSEGKSFTDSINLLVDKDEIYYNIADSYYKADDSWKDIQFVRFEVPDGIEISAEY